MHVHEMEDLKIISFLKHYHLQDNFINAGLIAQTLRTDTLIEMKDLSKEYTVNASSINENLFHTSMHDEEWTRRLRPHK